MIGCGGVGSGEGSLSGQHSGASCWGQVSTSSLGCGRLWDSDLQGDVDALVVVSQ